MPATELKLQGTSIRVPPREARSALQRVLGLPVTEAVARLRHGPHSCEPLARLIDNESGTDPRLLIAAAALRDGKDVIRVRRKAHGKADWITSPTSDVTITLGPESFATAVDNLPAPTPEPQAAAIWLRSLTSIESQVLEQLYDVLDPDLGINIVDFGFVRDVSITDEGVAVITMTLTSPTCPVTGVMVDQIRTALLEGEPVVSDFRVDWEWSPSWTPRDLSAEGIEQLRAIGFDPVAR